MDADETARVAALRRYRILDTDPEKAFDDLALLASEICGLREGGRGIHLINEFMDEVRFAQDGREIEMRKRGGAPGSPTEAEASP